MSCLGDTLLLQEIDGKALLLLRSDVMMKYMGLKLGPALKLTFHIDRLKQGRWPLWHLNGFRPLPLPSTFQDTRHAGIFVSPSTVAGVGKLSSSAHLFYLSFWKKLSFPFLQVLMHSVINYGTVIISFYDWYPCSCSDVTLAVVLVPYQNISHVRTWLKQWSGQYKGRFWALISTTYI